MTLHKVLVVCSNLLLCILLTYCDIQLLGGAQLTIPHTVQSTFYTALLYLFVLVKEYLWWTLVWAEDDAFLVIKALLILF